jgi:hypothetical protein
MLARQEENAFRVFAANAAKIALSAAPVPVPVDHRQSRFQLLLLLLLLSTHLFPRMLNCENRRAQSSLQFR